MDTQSITTYPVTDKEKYRFIRVVVVKYLFSRHIMPAPLTTLEFIKDMWLD